MILNEKKESVMKKAFALFMCLSVFFAMALQFNALVSDVVVATAYCEDGESDNEYADKASAEIGDVMSKTGDHVYDMIKRFVLICGGCGIGVAAVKMIFGGEKGMKFGFYLIAVIIVAVGVVFLAPLIIKAFGKWFVDSSSDMSTVTDILG